jgi:hypothetical protein
LKTEAKKKKKTGEGKLGNKINRNSRRPNFILTFSMRNIPREANVNKVKQLVLTSLRFVPFPVITKRPLEKVDGNGASAKGSGQCPAAE